MNKEILNALNELGHKLKPSEGSYKNKSIESFKIDLSNNYRELKQLLQTEEQNEIDTSNYEIHESGHVIPKEPEKPKFVKGMIVKKKNVHEDKYKYLMYSKNIERSELLDWKTLARTIAYFIPEAFKAVLMSGGNIIFINMAGDVCENSYRRVIDIPYPKPFGKYQEIDIKRG